MPVKEFKFKLKDVKDRKLSLLYDDDDHSLQVLVDGVLAGRDEQGTRYVIEDDSGNEIRFESGLDENWKPWLKANGEDVKLASALAWYQWVWIGLPVVLVFTGGMIGGMFGGAATYLNYVIMQSSRSAAVRYGVTMALSISAFFCYVIAVVLMNIAFGTQQGRSFVDAFKQGYSSAYESVTPDPAKPEGIPNVYVDNGSTSFLEFSVDGKAQGEIKPFEYKSLNLKPGKHKFVFNENKKEFDTIGAEVVKNKVCIINPKALSNFVIEKASFSSFNLVPGAGGTSFENIKGQKTASADYGLLEGVPEKIQVKSKAGEMGKIEYRTKLLKAFPENLGSQQAYAILKDEANSLKIFYYDDKDKFIIWLLNALGKEPRKPEYRDMLLDYSKKTEKYVLEAALKSLNNYVEEIPDDTLVALALADEKVNSSGMSSDSPAIDGRTGWAMKALLKRGKLALIAKDFPKLKKSQQATMLRIALMEGSDSLKKSLIDAVLDSPVLQDEFMLSSLLGIVASKEFVPDEVQMEKIDAMISKIEMDRVKKHWEKTWQEKLQAIAADGASNSYLDKKIMETFKSPDRQDFKLLVSFVKKGNYKPVLELFKSLPGYAKLDVLRALPYSKSEKVPQEAIELAWIGVNDGSDDLWRYGLHYLSANYPSRSEFLKKSWEYYSKIPDEKKKKEFARELWSCSYSHIDRMTVQELCMVASESPTEDFVKAAIGKLDRDRDKRAENFTELAKVYPSTGNEASRAMMMRQMKEVSYLQFAFRKQEDFKAIKDLIQLGLEDKSASAREPALEAAFKMENTEFPAEEAALKIISGADEQTRKNLQNGFDRWTCEIWRNKTSDRNERAKALSKITAVLERTEDKEIAKFANNSLANPDESEKTYVEALLRIADKNKLPDAREDSLRRLASLDVQKSPAVLAQILKSLEDPDLKVRYNAFCLAAPKSRDDKEGKILAKLKSVSAKETDPKTKSDMERILKSYLPSAPQPAKAPAKR
ncbi:MAG TPA: hypothetical protein DCZ94_04055 [Lentisphaeria bacterium]|nr:MAG: hypothetical protein A2X48_05275 [Lentisphaerae bacterium GWF2_49_21]HBC86109.1 hypothetical protein [Lentisphaeria bacterium]